LLQRTIEHEMQSVGNVRGARPSFSPFWVSPITTSR
jgi:hypothetical protein